METHMIFETHAHYDDEAFEQDREALLNSMEAHGIGHIVNACASIESLKATEELMEKYPFVYGAFGIHPDDAEKMTEDTLNEIRRLCHLPKAVAIGEIGLDYYWHKEEREHEIQKKMFRAQMEIAREEKMPFMIHSRDAARDTLELVKECMKEGMHGGIIHCFSCCSFSSLPSASALLFLYFTIPAASSKSCLLSSDLLLSISSILPWPMILYPSRPIPVSMNSS